MLILFYFFSIVSILAALLILSAKNPVHCAIALVLALFNIAGLYIMLDAPFLAAIQVLVYAGAIMVLFVFVIMLLNLKAEELVEQGVTGPFKFLVALLVISSFALTALVLKEPTRFQGLNVLEFGTIKFVGKALFTEYLVAFELTSILLTVAILGAIILAKRSLKP
ncbi:MAG: NADH-quinone oxidoreductase subunit J [Deltaproteobacteria bacterium]|nr:NADH-quinone oxidoreductase subunit J [Deltaproteobacteria bacterium]